jgi:ribosomal protein L11 methyltransferase
MPLIELQLQLPAERVEQWGDALLAAGALSVAIEDLDGDTPGEQAIYGEPGLPAPPAAWPNNRVTVLVEDALVEDAAGFEGWLAQLAAELSCAPPAIERRTRLDDRDWVRQTQAQFAPVAVGRIAIVPSWHEPPDPSACIVRIDPGAAFGTGTHATTRLCLSWLDRHLAPGASVLDYGCGSGILSICAARLGAGEVAGVDIDPQALAAARDNAGRNQVCAQYTSPDEFARDATRTFDLVVANILANPIMLLAPTLARRVRGGGTLLLSGILERQAGDVAAAFRAVDPALALEAWGRDDGWVALAGRRPG